MSENKKLIKVRHETSTKTFVTTNLIRHLKHPHINILKKLPNATKAKAIQNHPAIHQSKDIRASHKAEALV